MITTRSDSAPLALAAIIAEADGLLATIINLPVDHVEFDSMNDQWMELDSLILQTPSRGIRDQVAQLRHLLAILLNEDVSPHAEALARKALAEMETLEN